MTTMRERFIEVASEALETDERLAVVLAGISVDAFGPAKARHPNRVVNVGIREQAMVGVAAGLALEGMRPVVHTFAPFLVERPFESLKIDLAHQGVGAVLVSIGASHDVPAYGRVVAVGPILDAVSEAVADLDVTLLYAATVRPFDGATLRATLSEPAVVVVEPYLAGTSLPEVSRALGGLMHRACGLGVGHDGGVDLHRYGTRSEHDAAHGLDPAGLRARITRFFDGPADGARGDNSA